MTFIQTDRYAYPACTLSFGGRQCNKKLQAQGDNEEAWWCERCQNNCTAEWRYILSAQVSDHTGQHWLTAFQASPVPSYGAGLKRKVLHVVVDFMGKVVNLPLAGRQVLGW